MRAILANLFIIGGLAALYYLKVFNLLSTKYMSWFAILLVVSIFIIGFKILGSPFGFNDNDDDNDDDHEDSDSDKGPSRKKDEIS